ncbi:MAG: hypothetical protein ACREJL_04405 [Candidatus Methylomirabilales bacterium]
MRTLIGTVLGFLVLGMVGIREAEAINIQVREVRREPQPEGLVLVYELQNASVDRWDLRRVEAHILDHTGRRLDLLRPFTTLSRLERDDVEFIRTQIPATLLPAAHKLELRLFLQEVLGFPVADPPLKRLAYSFPLAPQTSPPLFRGKKTLRVEPAGMVEWEGRPRTIQLRLINQGRETLSDVILVGEIRGRNESLQKLRVPVTPRDLRPGAEAYASITIPQHVLERAQGVSLQAVYLKEALGNSARYIEDLDIPSRASRPEPAGSPTIAGWAR